MKLFSNIKNFIIGMLVGIANIIPGISGGTILALANLYEKSINDFAVIIKFRFKEKEWQKSFLDICKLLAGIGIGVIAFSHVMSWLLDSAFRATLIVILVLMFISLVQYAINFKPQYKKHFVLFTLGLVMPVAISMAHLNNVSFDFLGGKLGLFISGIISSFAMIVPGISGSMLLLVIGTYEIFVNAIKNLEIQNLLFLGMGIIIGVVGAIVGISKLYKNKKVQTEAFIFGLLISSLFALIMVIYKGEK